MWSWSTDLLAGHSRRARRAAAVAASALTLALGALVAESGTPTAAHRSRAVLRTTGRPVTPAPAGLTEAAIRFARSYVGALYGRDGADEVAPVSARLRRWLELGRARTTPAERASEVVVRGLRVVRLDPRTAAATGVVDDADSPPYLLSFNLTFTVGRWTVTTIDEGGPA